LNLFWEQNDKTKKNNKTKKERRNGGSQPNHPVNDPELISSRHLVFPLLDHMDGGEIFHMTSYNVSHFTSVLAPDTNPDDFRLLTWCIPEEDLEKESYEDLLLWKGWVYAVGLTGVCQWPEVKLTRLHQELRMILRPRLA
jgi:hypothetical protein